MEVQVFSKKLIKPSIPTPSHLHNMSISFMDQLVCPRSVPNIFYYSSNGSNYEANSIEHVDQRQKRLEKSLSETLTLYYPLAGRYIKENHLISCNDKGVEYVEALVNGQLSQLLQGEIEPKELNRFVPDEVEESATSALVAIQINIFKCGGLAIGMRISHRIIDAFTLSMFTNGWAKACKIGINDVTIPNFESGILFPPRNISEDKLPPLSESKSDQMVTKRFVFDTKTLSKLKADHQAAMRHNCKPSTNVILIALLWRAQINATRARHGRFKSSLLSVIMNLRGKKKFNKIRYNRCGNVFTRITANFGQANESKMMGLNEFVDQVRCAISNFIIEYTKVSTDDDEDGFFSKVIMKPYMEIFDQESKKGEGDVHEFSSLRNLPFYEVDFGWGKPAWVSLAQRPYKGVVFIDGKDGDRIEAWVTMEEVDMAYFQQDPDVVLSINELSRNGNGNIPIPHPKM